LNLITVPGTILLLNLKLRNLKMHFYDYVRAGSCKTDALHALYVTTNGDRIWIEMIPVEPLVEPYYL